MHSLHVRRYVRERRVTNQCHAMREQADSFEDTAKALRMNFKVLTGLYLKTEQRLVYIAPYLHTILLYGQR